MNQNGREKVSSARSSSLFVLQDTPSKPRTRAREPFPERRKPLSRFGCTLTTFHAPSFACASFIEHARSRAAQPPEKKSRPSNGTAWLDVSISIVSKADILRNRPVIDLAEPRGDRALFIATGRRLLVEKGTGEIPCAASRRKPDIHPEQSTNISATIAACFSPSGKRTCWPPSLRSNEAPRRDQIRIAGAERLSRRLALAADKSELAQSSANAAGARLHDFSHEGENRVYFAWARGLATSSGGLESI